MQYFKDEYAFLSNFYPCKIVDDLGVVYSTVEHAYQAAKSLDVVDRIRVAQAPTPKQAKKIGKELRVRRDWDSIKIDVMRSFLQQKFRDKSLRDQLLSTGDIPLVENNYWHDTFWGVFEGQGLNHLGVLLMELRDSYRL